MRPWISFPILTPLIILGCNPHPLDPESSRAYPDLENADQFRETGSLTSVSSESKINKPVNQSIQLPLSIEEQIEDIITRRIRYSGPMEIQLANLGPDAIPGIVALLYDPEFKWPGTVLNSLEIMAHPDAAEPLLVFIEDLESNSLDSLVSIPWVLRTIGATGNPVATPKLLELILANNTEMRTKNAAAMALLSVNGDQYAEFVNRFVIDAYLFRAESEYYMDSYVVNELVVSISALPSAEAFILTRDFLMQDLASGMATTMIDNIAKRMDDEALLLLFEFSAVNRPETEVAYQAYAIDKIVQRDGFENVIDPERLIRRLYEFQPGLGDLRLSHQGRTVTEMINHLEFEF